ncbi:MAG: SDR family NAD(P)-dependent oxidoreductase [Solirubrobacteraceae bacterium]
MSRVALVTGATQGLGLALVQRLAASLDSADTVYLTGRDRGRVAEAHGHLASGGGASVETAWLDVSLEDSVAELGAKLRDRHGTLDIVISNAYTRVLPGDRTTEMIDRYVETNNFGTTRVLRTFMPLIADGGTMLVVASTLGTLHYLAPVLHRRFDGLETLAEVDHQVDRWRNAVHDGSALPEGWPAFINIPSKIAQVSAVRTLAGLQREADVPRETLLAAVCPGMIDTDASRPWFDMSGAQTPDQAAGALVELALRRTFEPSFYGELVRFGAVVPWKP